MLQRMALETSDARGWIEEHLYLPTKYGSGASWSLYSWQRGMIEAYQSPEVYQVTGMLATQVFKTGILNGLILHKAATSPSQMLLVYPTEKTARKIIKNKLSIQIMACRPLQDRVDKHFDANRGKRGARRKLTSNMESLELGAGAVVSIGHSHARSTMIGETISAVFADEFDEFADPVTALGDMRSRLSVEGRDGKLFVISSPKKPGESPIYDEFLLGSRRKFWVYCVHCPEGEGGQLLTWDNVTLAWDGRRKRYTGKMHCPLCGCLITDDDRKQMIEGGEWWKEVPTDDGVTYEPGPWEGHESFTISRLYLPDVPLNDICALWREGTAYEAKFYADVLGQPYSYDAKPELFAVDWNKIITYILPYQAPLQAITAGVDVQDDRLEFSVYGWYNDPEEPNAKGMCYEHSVVPYKVEGVDGVAPAFVTLYELISKYRPDSVLVDIGYLPDTVRQAVLGFAPLREMYAGKRLYPCYGMARKSGKTFGLPLTQNPSRIAGMSTHKIPTDEAKLLLWSLISQGDLHAFKGGIPDEWTKQLLAETLAISETGDLYWKEVRKRNESLDCAVYALTAFHNLDVGYTRPKQSVAWNEGRQVLAPVPTERDFIPNLVITEA